MRHQLAWVATCVLFVACSSDSSSNGGGGSGGKAGKDGSATGGSGGNGGSGGKGGSGGSNPTGGSGGSIAGGTAGASGGVSGASGAGGAPGGSGGSAGAVGSTGGSDASLDAPADVVDAGCPAGFGDCDSTPGCETNLQTSTTHCGACSISCANLNGTNSCVGGTCSPQCAAGWGDCDNSPNNGCETHILSNADHCGSCSNDCGTSGCANGQCVPVAGLTTLATLPSNVLEGIALDATNVYFANYSPPGGVGFVPIGGGSITMLATGSIATYLAVDASYAYYTTDKSLQRVPLTGGASSQVGGALKAGAGVIVRGSTVYYADTGTGSVDGAIWSYPSGGLATVLASQQGAPLQIASDGTNLFWTGTTNSGFISGAVMKMPIGGGSATPLVSNLNAPLGIAADTSYVYWANLFGSPYTSVDRVPIAGGSAATVVTALISPTFVATDGVNVYVSHARGIVKAPVAGGSQATLVPAGPGNPTGIALDATHIYWVTNYGEIKKAFK